MAMVLQFIPQQSFNTPQQLLCHQWLAVPGIAGKLGVGFQERLEWEGTPQHGARGSLASLWLELLQQHQAGGGWAQLSHFSSEPVPTDLKLTFYSKHGVFVEEKNVTREECD